MTDDSFAHGKPDLSIDELAEICRSNFGTAEFVEQFAGERDQNALFRDEAGNLLILKIANRGERVETLQFQNAILCHLDERQPGLAPRPIRSTDGELTVAADTPSGRHLVRALTFTAGEPLARVEKDMRLWRGLGRKLGLMSAALQDFHHPGAERTDFLWNLDRPEVALGWVDEVEDAPTRRRIAGFVRARAGLLRERSAVLRKAVLHQDANDHNVLVHGSPTPAISGFIDFGDALYGPQINELAVALAYAGMDSDDPLSIFETVIGGYTSRFILLEPEIDVLPDLIFLRLAQSVCISSHNVREFPGNAAYLTISQAPAQALIARLAELDQDVVLNRFRLAAGFRPKRISPQLTRTPALLERRRQRIAPSLSVAYREPLTIVRGEGAILYDDTGRPFLDLVNNVAHVGHCHPHVVQALARQADILNTNARYLHPLLLDYADRITASLPAPLSVCVFVNSGSEANELAIRMARTFTGREDAVVLDGAYHGHTTALVDVSPYKFARKGGQGRKPFVHVAAMPDPYRGAFRGMTGPTGQAYADDVARAVSQADQRGGPAFFIAESYLGVGGQVILPPNYLRGAYDAVRAAGGVCIADEVQVGFGRPGTAMWAFEEQGVVPDIITVGKPIGAGHPMAAVVTTPEIARSFANGMEYFSTFGGNPVSCAVGMAVLDVIEDEDLMGNARRTGRYIMEGLENLAERFEIIGDVRGRGFFIGAELVLDRQARTPATRAASDLVNRLRGRGILLSTDGPGDNVLKIKPPMVITTDHADQFLAALEAELIA